MSGKLMGQCFSIVLTRVARDVLQALSDHAKDDGTGAFPSVALLAWKTDLSERQTQRVLKKLASMQLIERVAYAKGGRGRTPHYRVNIAAGTQKAPFESHQKGDNQKSPFTATKGDISRSKRVTFRTVKGDISSQKGDMKMSPDPSSEPSVEPSHTPRELKTSSNGQRNHRNSVCAESISLERFMAYARAHPGIHDPETWAAKARKTGEWNERVLRWEQEQESKLAVAREHEAKQEAANSRLKDFESRGEVCPRCHGTQTEILPGMGGRPCDHLAGKTSRARSRKIA